MGVCYDENIIEYDEYSDYPDEENVEMEVHPEDLLEYTENVECDNSQYETTDTDLHGYQLDEEDVYTVITASNTQNFVIKSDTKAYDCSTSQQKLQNSSDQKQQQLIKNLRALRLKYSIQRENNRLRKKLINCRCCGTNPRFLDMQIRSLQAEKQKLLEETTILRLTKDKLLNQVTLIEANVIVE